MSELKKGITLFGLTMIAVGACIGSGIFLTPSDIAANLPSGKLILLVWVVGGIIAITGALTFSELGALFPKAGGVYVFIKEAFGPLPGFLFGWITLTVVNSGAIAALSVAFARYFTFLIPSLDNAESTIAIIAIALLTFINVIGVKFGEIFSSTFTILKLIGILIIVLVALTYATYDTSEIINSSNIASDKSMITGFGLALIGVIWSFGGWVHATYLAGETKNAKKVVPLAMLFGALIVTVMYLVTNYAYLALMTPAEMAASNAIAAESMQKVFPFGAVLVAILIAASTFGTIGIYTLTAPRVYFAMAKDKLFFPKLAEIHPKYQTPLFAILLQSIWSILLVLFWGTFENLITYVIFIDWVFITLAATTIFVFRKRQNLKSPFRTPGYPVIPLIFIAISVWFIITTLVGRPIQAVGGIIILLIGLPIYFMFKRKNT
jgi:APA family basic amino acid/polyamine antiporter